MELNHCCTKETRVIRKIHYYNTFNKTLKVVIDMEEVEVTRVKDEYVASCTASINVKLDGERHYYTSDNLTLQLYSYTELDMANDYDRVINWFDTYLMKYVENHLPLIIRNIVEFSEVISNIDLPVREQFVTNEIIISTVNQEFEREILSSSNEIDIHITAKPFAEQTLVEEELEHDCFDCCICCPYCGSHDIEPFEKLKKTDPAEDEINEEFNDVGDSIGDHFENSYGQNNSYYICEDPFVEDDKDENEELNKPSVPPIPPAPPVLPDII